MLLERSSPCSCLMSSEDSESYLVAVTSWTNTLKHLFTGTPLLTCSAALESINLALRHPTLGSAGLPQRCCRCCSFETCGLFSLFPVPALSQPLRHGVLAISDHTELRIRSPRKYSAPDIHQCNWYPFLGIADQSTKLLAFLHKSGSMCTGQ